MKLARNIGLSICFVCLSTGSSVKLHADTPLDTVLVASGFSRPVFATAPPGDSDRLFVLEQHTGHIRIVNLQTGQINPTPFLTLDGLPTGLEEGLASMAFPSDYATTGQFYVNYVSTGRTTHIARGTVSEDPDIANPTLEDLLTLAHPTNNHHGGSLVFGPDDFLYIGMGDGGPQNDPSDRGQDVTLLHGKILRIGVDGDDFPDDPARNYTIPSTNPFVGMSGRDEIWAYGLRAPWRFSFDRITDDLYIADVGQYDWEEIDFQSGGAPGGANYGWRCREGAHDFDNSTSNPCGTCSDPKCPLVDPIHEYSHATGRAIIGGYVYRGCAIPDLRGAYFFGDHGSERIWSLRYDGETVNDLRERTTELAPDTGSIDKITSFGEDANGELYICDFFGEVFKIVPAQEPTVPASHDYDNNGQVDLFDFARFIECSAGPFIPYADCLCDVFDGDGDRDIDLRDYQGFQLAFGTQNP